MSSDRPTAETTSTDSCIDASRIDDAHVEEAVSRVLQGDRSAFEVVVRRFQRPLRAWLAVQASPGIDVDEVAQQTFVNSFSRLHEYELGTNFGAWLFTICRFQLKTEVTRLRRVADYHTRYAPELLQRELDRRDTESPELVQDRLEHLRTCLGTLGEQTHRFIRWRYEEEIPLEEMANRSGRSIPAIKKQLWLLRRKLQDCVDQRMATEGKLS